MPSRPVVALIAIAWLATLGWFAKRELVPMLFPGEAPPFVIELGDEVTSQMAGEVKRPDVLWGIYRGDTRIGRAETRLRYFEDDDTFELETRIVKMEIAVLIIKIEVPEMISAYRIDRTGTLRRFRFTGSFLLAGARMDVALNGTVQDGKLLRTGTLHIPGFGGPITPEFEPIDAPQGSILNPTHPVPKIKGIQPGRRWRMALLDPMADAVEPIMQSLLKQKGQPGQPSTFKMPARPTHVEAEVLTEPTNVVYNGQEHACWVIEFKGLNEPAKTYVRIRDGAVLRQEVEKFVLQRE